MQSYFLKKLKYTIVIFASIYCIVCGTCLWEYLCIICGCNFHLDRLLARMQSRGYLQSHLVPPALAKCWLCPRGVYIVSLWCPWNNCTLARQVGVVLQCILQYFRDCCRLNLVDLLLIFWHASSKWTWFLCTNACCAAGTLANWSGSRPRNDCCIHAMTTERFWSETVKAAGMTIHSQVSCELIWTVYCTAFIFLGASLVVVKVTYCHLQNFGLIAAESPWPIWVTGNVRKGIQL